EEWPIIHVEALPGEPATLEIQDRGNEGTLWDLGTMPASGTVDCPPVTFRDYLLGEHFAAARIGVQCRGRTNWSNVWLAAARKIQLEFPNPPEEWSGFHLPRVGQVLQELRKLEDRSAELLEIDPQILKTPLAQFISDCALSAQIVENTKILGVTSLEAHASP